MLDVSLQLISQMEEVVEQMKHPFDKLRIEIEQAILKSLDPLSAERALVGLHPVLERLPRFDQKQSSLFEPPTHWQVDYLRRRKKQLKKQLPPISELLYEFNRKQVQNTYHESLVQHDKAATSYGKYGHNDYDLRLPPLEVLVKDRDVQGRRINSGRTNVSNASSHTTAPSTSQTFPPSNFLSPDRKSRALNPRVAPGDGLIDATCKIQRAAIARATTSSLLPLSALPTPLLSTSKSFGTTAPLARVAANSGNSSLSLLSEEMASGWCTNILSVSKFD
jgi:hypothetical protein